MEEVYDKIHEVHASSIKIVDTLDVARCVCLLILKKAEEEFLILRAWEEIFS
jgi:hypothetical protein